MKHETKMFLLCVALAIAGCGGGGSSSETATASSGPQVASPSAVSPASVSAPFVAPQSVSADVGGSAPLASPDGDGLRQPRPAWPVGPDAPRSGRSLNWWQTSPVDIDTSNRNCSPQPDCVIPDGDLMEWNRFCAQGQNVTGYPVEFCMVRLYDEPPRPPVVQQSGPPPGLTRPDPMTATQSQADEWNRFCNTARCMITPGVPS